MSEITFVDELPGVTPKRGSSEAPYLAPLRANSGQWAEVRRYDTAKQAYSFGHGAEKRHADIEATTRVVDGQYAVFLRAVSE